MLCGLLSFSQEQDLNLFGNKPTKLSLCTSFNLGYQEFPDIKQNSITFGGSVGILVNNKMSFGLFGMTNTDNPQKLDPYYKPPLENTYLRYSMWGLYMDARIFNILPIHPIVSIKAGGGTSMYRNYNLFYMIEPTGGIELNLVKHFKMAGVIGYRITDQSLINGWNYNLSFNFIFGQHRK